MRDGGFFDSDETALAVGAQVEWLANAAVDGWSRGRTLEQPSLVVAAALGDVGVSMV